MLSAALGLPKSTVLNEPGFLPVSCSWRYTGQRVDREAESLVLGGRQADSVMVVAATKEKTSSRDLLIGPELSTLLDQPRGVAMPFGLMVKVWGHAVDGDVAGVLRQWIVLFLNQLDGVSFCLDGTVPCLCLSTKAIAAGISLRSLAAYIRHRLVQEAGGVLEACHVVIGTSSKAVAQFRAWDRDLRRGPRGAQRVFMPDTQADVFYSCVICQSVHPGHVCIIAPERGSMCGSFGWSQAKAFHRLLPFGPCQPVTTGEAVDSASGSWSGVNQVVRQLSMGRMSEVCLHSVLSSPSSVSSWTQCIVGILPACNGFFVVDRAYRGLTPLGLSFAELVDTLRDLGATPGFAGCDYDYVVSPAFLRGDGGLPRLVWMPKQLKLKLLWALEVSSCAHGIPGLVGMIATEDDVTDEEQLRHHLVRVGHPALRMTPLV